MRSRKVVVKYKVTPDCPHWKEFSSRGGQFTPFDAMCIRCFGFYRTVPTHCGRCFFLRILLKHRIVEQKNDVLGDARNTVLARVFELDLSKTVIFSG